MARALAAYKLQTVISEIDLLRALDLIFSTKLKRQFGESMNPTFLQETFLEIWHKIGSFPEPTSFESHELSLSSHPEIFRSSAKIGNKYSENSLPKKPSDLHEIENHSFSKNDSKDRFTNYNFNSFENPGVKGGAPDENSPQGKRYSFSTVRLLENPIIMDVSMIFKQLHKRKRIVNYTGKGSRIKVLSRSGGRYIFARKPINGLPHSIAFDASIKSHFLNYPQSLEKIENTIFRKKLKIKILL